MEIVTFFWLVLSGIGVVALLMLVQEVRAFRGEARHVRYVLHTELLKLQQLLAKQENLRVHREAREAEERLTAVREGREDAEQRIDVGRLLDETKASTWAATSDRIFMARIRADAEWEKERQPFRSSHRT